MLNRWQLFLFEVDVSFLSPALPTYYGDKAQKVFDVQVIVPLRHWINIEAPTVCQHLLCLVVILPQTYVIVSLLPFSGQEAGMQRGSGNCSSSRQWVIELDASIHILSSALFPERLPKINLYLMLCDNLEVWDGVGRWEGGSRGRGHTCTDG